MKKINFKNNEQPAINDTNLNLMQDNIENELNAIATELSKSEIYVGKEEPVAGEKVWFRKGKNLCNGINQHCFLTTTANICNIATGDTGLAIPL